MYQVRVMNEYQTQTIRKNATTIAVVVLSHLGSLWAISQFKAPEMTDPKKDPIVVRFFNLQSPPNVEIPKEQPKPEPKVKPEPIKPAEKVEKIQSVEKSVTPKQVVMNKTPVVGASSNILPIVEAQPVEQPVVQQSTPVEALAPVQPVTTAPVVKDVQFGANGVQWRREPRISIDESELRGVSRMVLLMIEADEKGDITAVKILQSSGIASLDAKVMRAVRSAKLKPYMENGLAYPVKAKQPFQFN